MQSDSTPSLLKPPSIVSTFKGLNKSSDAPLVLLPIDTKSSIPQKCLAASNQSKEMKEKSPDSVSSETSAVAGASPSTVHQPPQFIQKKSSFKKQFSSKRRKSKPKPMNTADDIVLNNGRKPSITSATSATSQQLRKTDNLMQTTNRIQNDTKDMNPQNSFRHTVAARRASCMMISNNSQPTLLQQFNRQNSMKNHPNLNYRRRMSSIEQAFEKTSNINLCNLENMKSNEFVNNSKLNLSNIQKSLSNINESDRHPESESPTNICQDQTKKIKRWCMLFRPDDFTSERESYSLYIFSENNR